MVCPTEAYPGLFGPASLRMTSSEPDQPSPARRRRPRYRGKNPRRFEEKYKELDPKRYPEHVAHVRARGATPAGQHVSILVEEVLAALDPKPGERGVDATLGYGGHAERLLARSLPGGALLALDADPIELAKTEARLRQLGHGERELIVRRTNFAAVRASLDEIGWEDGADFFFADLGLSSMQIDDPARGFTFKHDGPLDMRMNPKRALSAAQWLARAEPAELERVLALHSDEPRAHTLALALHARRGTLDTTLALARAVRDALAGQLDAEAIERSVRRVFQALRIEVNDELGALDRLLLQLPDCLRAGGRAAFLSFHSGEDRRVKLAFQRGSQSGVYREISGSVIRASAQERRANPRAAPAKLRWAVRM
ncbi:MAG TPA: 16S rRNA (cytosine(1402)-N(4))-methyltransferase RsmH [Planctomycetota bacterium]|nr:16S rRNA (cytosine(1402)-N(4))-methyltransferase RsmH [Planctomycetota bacterium]